MYGKYRLPVLAVLAFLVIVKLTVATIMISEWFVVVLASLFLLELVRNFLGRLRHSEEISAREEVIGRLKIEKEALRVQKERFHIEACLRRDYLRATDYELWQWIELAGASMPLDEKTQVALDENTPLTSPDVVTGSLLTRHTIAMLAMPTEEEGTDSISLETDETGGDDE